MDNNYDTLWDLEENDGSYLSKDENAFKEIFSKWEKRPWDSWLFNNLKFPFFVERIEDEDDAYFTDIAESELFRLGHVMEAIGIEEGDSRLGIALKVKESNKVGYVPLCEVEVTSKEDENYWPVREYVVWDANH